METRANYALIGAFTLGVIALAFGFVFWFSGGDNGQKRQSVRVVFSGSVSGLSKGSTVLFNGLRVGEVGDVRLLPEDPRRVVGIVEVDRQTPIRTDTHARLEYQGLTGVAQVALVGGEPGAPPLTPPPGEALATIFADRSDFQDLMETARNISRRADEVLERVGRVVTDNEGAINRSFKNIESFTQALGENAPGLNRFLAQAGTAAERLGPLAAKLEGLSTSLDELVRSVDRKRVTSMVENLDNFTQALGSNRQAINDTLQNVAGLSKRLNDAAPKLEATLTDIGNVAKAVDAVKLGRTIDNADRFAQALGNTSQDVEKTVREARAMTEKLNQSAGRVDSVLKAAENFLGSASGEAGKGTFDEVRQAARSIRVLADNLDKRTAEITVGLTRFTNSGLREYGALAADGRRAVNDVGRTARSLERNPQQVIFGARPTIPEYTGR